jgi:hypothetical protein
MDVLLPVKFTSIILEDSNTNRCSGILGAFVLGALSILLPGERPVDRGGHIDWIGASLGTGGLIVFNVAWKYVTRTKPRLITHNDL